MKQNDSKNNVIILNIKRFGLFFEKFSKEDQVKLLSNLESNKIYILKLFRGEKSKIVLISTGHLWDENDLNFIKYEKHFDFSKKEKLNIDVEKLINEAFEKSN